MEIQYVGLIVVFIVLGYMISQSRRTRQLAYIENYEFPHKVAKRIKEEYPHLSDEDVTIVFDALRDYFYMCLIGKKQMVSMPSQVVDVAWHEFILFTRNYKEFCTKAIGRFLHHTPTEAMKTPTLAREGIKRAWRLACVKEKIDPSAPCRLPLIFAIDNMLNIEDGFKYSLNCGDKSSPMYGSGYCAGDIGCASGCAGDSGHLTSSSDSGGFFGGSSDSGDSGGSSGCGGGCGGS